MGRSRKAKARKSIKEFQMNCLGGFSSTASKLERKRGKATTVTISAGNTSGFFNPNTTLCKNIRLQLLKDSMSSPVRFPKERIGEVVNLSDPACQQRSKAQILARKYCTESQFLRNIYNAGIRRELTEKECFAVFRCVGELGARTEQQSIEPPGNSDAGPSLPGVRGGCSGDDLPEPGLGDLEGDSLDSSDLAEPEETGEAEDSEEDSCL